MNFQLKFPIQKSSFQIEYGHKITLIGSCFSDSVSTHFSRSGFEVLSNPFGTIFHPNVIARVLEDSLNGSETVDILQRDDRYFSWDAASKLVGISEIDLKDKFIESRNAFRSFLESSTLFVITFGTAWGYELKSSGKTVANCHKKSSELFEKKLMNVESELVSWQRLIEKLYAVNPELKIVFTVSPVRHKKDGLIENNRSKSRLIELVLRLNETTSTTYFPSYEIIIDELRDYRFFKEDRVHPTDEAVNYVWERFEEVYFSEVSRDLAQKVRQLHAAFAHRSLHPGSTEATRHEDDVNDKFAAMKRAFPAIFWRK